MVDETGRTDQDRKDAKELANSIKKLNKQMHKSSDLLKTAVHPLKVVGNVLGLLSHLNIFSTIKDLQKSFTSVNTTFSKQSEKLANTFNEMGIGLSIGLTEHAGIMEAGLRNVQKGVIKLAADARFSGQSSEKHVKTMIMMMHEGGITQEAMNRVADQSRILSKQYGFQTGKLMESLDALKESMKEWSVMDVSEQIGLGMAEAKAMFKELGGGGQNIEDAVKFLTSESEKDVARKAMLGVSEHAAALANVQEGTAGAREARDIILDAIQVAGHNFIDFTEGVKGGQQPWFSMGVALEATMGKQASVFKRLFKHYEHEGLVQKKVLTGQDMTLIMDKSVDAMGKKIEGALLEKYGKKTTELLDLINARIGVIADAMTYVVPVMIALGAVKWATTMGRMVTGPGGMMAMGGGTKGLFARGAAPKPGYVYSKGLGTWVPGKGMTGAPIPGAAPGKGPMPWGNIGKAFGRVAPTAGLMSGFIGAAVEYAETQDAARASMVGLGNAIGGAVGALGFLVPVVGPLLGMATTAAGAWFGGKLSKSILGEPEAKKDPTGKALVGEDAIQDYRLLELKRITHGQEKSAEKLVKALEDQHISAEELKDIQTEAIVEAENRMLGTTGASPSHVQGGRGMDYWWDPSRRQSRYRSGH